MILPQAMIFITAGVGAPHHPTRLLMVVELQVGLALLDGSTPDIFRKV
jgi:hypothetical protein